MHSTFITHHNNNVIVGVLRNTGACPVRATRWRLREVDGRHASRVACLSCGLCAQLTWPSRYVYTMRAGELGRRNIRGRWRAFACRARVDRDNCRLALSSGLFTSIARAHPYLIAHPRGVVVIHYPAKGKFSEHRRTHTARTLRARRTPNARPLHARRTPTARTPTRCALTPPRCPHLH
jgi:hypothetical protein